MIKIRKGSHVIKVSKCAYKDTFKKLGYEIVNNSAEEVINTSSTETINNNVDKFIEEEKEINKELNKEDEITSDKLNVNVIGENIENFDIKEEKSTLEKVLEKKKNISKRK